MAVHNDEVPTLLKPTTTLWSLSYSEETFSVFRLPPHIIIDAVTYIYLSGFFYLYFLSAEQTYYSTRPGVKCKSR